MKLIKLQIFRNLHVNIDQNYLILLVFCLKIMSLESNYITVIQKSFQNEKIRKINIFQLGEGMASKIQEY